MGWVDRVTPWFAVAVIALAAVWLAFATYDTFTLYRSSARWGYAAIYAASLVGAVCMGLIAVRAAWPSRKWPPDGAVRVLGTLGLLLVGFTAPLIVLRAQYGLGESSSG